jgi:hypothetical protein
MLEIANIQPSVYIMPTRIWPTGKRVFSGRDLKIRIEMKVRGEGLLRTVFSEQYVINRVAVSDQ